MRISPLLAVAIVGGAVALVGVLWNEKKPTGELRARARRPLSTLEQELYWRLVEAFPGMVVLAQVALSSLITTPRKDRLRFANKSADFVLLDREFQPVVMFELDDGTDLSTHSLGETVRELLEFSGYRVIELTAAPTVAELRRLVPLEPAA